MTGKYGEIHGQCLIGPPCNPDGETKIALVIERSAQMTVWVGIAFVLDVKKLEKAMDILEQSLMAYQIVMADRSLVEA